MGRAPQVWLALNIAVLLVGAGSPVIAQRNVTLAWDASKDEGVENYRVYSGVRSGLYSRATPTGGKTHLTIGGLKEGLIYYFSVTAINWGGVESFPSEEIQFAGPCAGRIVQLTATSVQAPGQGVKLAISATPGRKYLILGSADLQTWTPAWTSSIASARAEIEFVDATVSPFDRRFYRAEVTGPYIELPEALAVSTVPESNTVARIGFTAAAGAGYEVQTSADGISWKTVWSDPTIATEGWIELLDQQTNSVVSRRYRLLSASILAASGQTPCPGSASQAPFISDLSAQETYSGVPTLPLPLSVFDPDTPATQLDLSATSSDPSLLPPGQIKFAGNGTNRTVTLTPVGGKSGVVVVELFVSDGENTAATAFQLQVRPEVPTTFPISIHTTGAGAIQPDRNGQMLTVGKRYTVTAVPAQGQIFVGWSGDIESNSPQLTFVMRPRLTIEAVFAENLFAAIQGAYNGLFRAEGDFQADRAGSFAVTTTERGTYSGKLTLSGKSYSFTGQLDFERNGTNLITRAEGSPLTIELTFGAGDSDQANGRVTDGSWQAPLRGFRAGYDARSHPAPFAGTYTLILPGGNPPTLGPQGASVGAVKIDGNGLASFAGTLADGTKVALKSALSKDGDWAFHAPLYSKLGTLHGWQNVSLDTSNSIHGTIYWTKPSLPKTKLYGGGFTVEADATGSRYAQPSSTTMPVLSLSETDLVFAGGELPASFTNRIALIAKNKIANLGGDKLSMKVTLSSGLFSGTVTEPSTGKSMPFKGALLQDRNRGVGFLLGPDMGARVEFGP